MDDKGLLGRYLLKTQGSRIAQRESGVLETKARIVMDQLMPHQRALADDGHKRKAMLSPGRAGKTHAVRAMLFNAAMTVPGSMSVYIGLNRMRAEAEIWNGSSGFIALCDALGLREPQVKFDRSRLMFTVPELRSTVMVGGADDLRAIEAYRGGSGYHLVAIDEAKSHNAKLLETLLVDILEPRVLPRNGTILLCGTPGSILDSLFYRITRTGSDISIPFGDQHAMDSLKWSAHRWSLDMNTTPIPGSSKSMWDMALEVKRDRGWSDKNPTWIREYTGGWCSDSTDFVYRFNAYDENGAQWNVWTPTGIGPFGLPSMAKIDGVETAIHWQFAIGLDLGAKDQNALEVLAFAPQTKRIYQVHEWCENSNSIDVIASQLDKAVKMIQKHADYPVAIVADCAHLGEMVLREILLKVGHKCEPARKANKLGAIEIINDDLVDGRLRLLVNSAAAKQMAELQYAADGIKENPMQKNDASDSVTYARNSIIDYISRTQPVAEIRKSPEETAMDKLFANLQLGDANYQYSEYVPE